MNSKYLCDAHFTVLFRNLKISYDCTLQPKQSYCFQELWYLSIDFCGNQIFALHLYHLIHRNYELLENEYFELKASLLYVRVYFGPLEFDSLRIKFKIALKSPLPINRKLNSKSSAEQKWIWTDEQTNQIPEDEIRRSLCKLPWQYHDHHHIALVSNISHSTK